MRKLTTAVTLIVRLASSASTSFTVHRLTTLLLLSTQTNGVFDALHDFWKSVRIVGIRRLMFSRLQNGVFPPVCAIRCCICFGWFVKKCRLKSKVPIERRDVVRRSGVSADSESWKEATTEGVLSVMARAIICATRGIKSTERFR
jgi:hypothetical protein